MKSRILRLALSQLWSSMIGISPSSHSNSGVFTARARHARPVYCVALFISPENVLFLSVRPAARPPCGVGKRRQWCVIRFTTGQDGRNIAYGTNGQRAAQSGDCPVVNISDWYGRTHENRRRHRATTSRAAADRNARNVDVRKIPRYCNKRKRTGCGRYET